MMMERWGLEFLFLYKYKQVLTFPIDDYFQNLSKDSNFHIYFSKVKLPPKATTQLFDQEDERESFRTKVYVRRTYYLFLFFIFWS